MEPLWKGPIEEGVTYTLLNKYLCCRERFRILTIEGLRPLERFNAPLEYGNMWHVCEEAIVNGSDDDLPKGRPKWSHDLETYCNEMLPVYPAEWESIQKWRRVCEIQFAAYLDHYNSKNGKAAYKAVPILREEVFHVPYVLPSGRFVTLLGKWDGIDDVTYDGTRGIFVRENKTKGTVDRDAIISQLKFDLQTGIYIVALTEQLQGRGDKRITLSASKRKYPAGVVYNVVKRPLSSGKHCIRQHQPTKSKPSGESQDEYFARLEDLIRNDSREPDGSHYYFRRWIVGINNDDVIRLKIECLNPLLENLCDDYEWWDYCATHGVNPFDVEMRRMNFEHMSRHFRMPFGCYSDLLENGKSDMDAYLDNGSTAGLGKVTSLFPELSV